MLPSQQGLCSKELTIPQKLRACTAYKDDVPRRSYNDINGENPLPYTYLL
jgi:hypothetical protein